MLFPYIVTTNITSSVPYLNGTWMNDRAFKEIPFNLTVNVTYDSDAVACFGISIPSNVTVDITMPNGTVLSDLMSLSGGTGEKVYTYLKSSIPGTGNVVVTDTANGLVAPPEYFQVYDWTINFVVVGFSLVNPPYSWIPFNITGTINALTTLGGLGLYTLGVNDTLSLEILGTGYTGTATMTNGTAPFNMTDITLPAGTYNLQASLDSYTPTTIYGFNVAEWNITITPTINCTTCPSCTEFYAGVNQTLNITIEYPVEPYNITSIANYSILLNGIEVYTGTINVVNNTGSVVLPVNFPESGTVEIRVWDETYHPDYNSTTIPVSDWDLIGGYIVTQYPGTWYETYDSNFYVGIPGALNLTVLYNEPCPVNSTLNITVELPNGTVLNYYPVAVVDNNSVNFTVPEEFLFSEPGYVHVTITDESLNKTVTLDVPIKDWGIFVDVSPEELVENESTNVNVFVVESLYFDWPGTRDVNVTLELPDGYTVTKNLTLEANDDVYYGQGGYQGIVTFENVTPTIPGLGWVTVTDVLSGKTVRMPVEVKVPTDYVGTVVVATVTPEDSPVYAYIPNKLNIDIKYYVRDAQGGLTDEEHDHDARVIVYDADDMHTPIYNSTVHVPNGHYIMPPVTVPVNGIQNIVVEVIDLANNSVRSTAEIPVSQWNVTFDFATDGPVWKYVDNTLNVTVHVNGPDKAVNVSINGAPAGTYNDGDVIQVNLVDPQGTLTFNVIATYNGHQVGSDSYTITPEEWNVTFDFSVKDHATGIPELYQWFDGDLMGTVHVNGPNVPVNVTHVTWAWMMGTYYDGQNFGFGWSPVLDHDTWDFVATYNGHTVGTATLEYYGEPWETVVSAPSELYYLPDGYTNKNVEIGVDLEGLPEIITEGYNVTIELNVTLPNGTVMIKTVNGTNSTVFDLGDLTFNESGTITYLVAIYKYAWGSWSMIDSESGSIPIKLALNASILGTYYENIPVDVSISVDSISASPNLTITIEGTNYTISSDHDGPLVIPDVELPAGNYTVTIHDSSLNATIIRTLEVRGWDIYVTVNPDEITAGSVYNVDFTIDLKDYYGQPVAVNDKLNLLLEFSDTGIIPSGFYNLTYTITPSDMGHLERTLSVFSPVAGTFQVIVSDKYGKVNDTEQILVDQPNPNDLTYVYVNIRKQGSLSPPDEPVKLYWGLELGGVRKYFPVFNATISEDYSEAMFTLYPRTPFSLYVIAAPLNVTAPILTEGQTWAHKVVVQNDTITTYTKNVTVTPMDGGWDISVSVYKATLNNVTVDYYTYKPPSTPGVIELEPGSASVQGNAIYTGIDVETEHSEDYIFGPYETSNSTEITIVPNELTLELLDSTTLKPTQEGEHFTFKAMLSITNAEEQFDAQWTPFEGWLSSIPFLTDDEKEELVSEILDQIGDVSAVNGPVANETLDFHIDNTAIAYLDPTNATTDADGSATFMVYTKATGDMTPEELMNLMGAVKAWATYDSLISNDITVNFGGAGSISGDITDDSGMQIPGATVVVKMWNGTAWVNATDFAGNVLMAVSADDGHYSISNVPAAVEGTNYMVVATKGNLTGYAYVTVYPFATSTADVKLRGVSENSGFAVYPERVDNAETVYFVFNNLGTPDAFSASQYLSRTIPADVRTKSVLASEFDMDQVTANDVVISVGGPLVNPVTAAYEDMAPVHMAVNGSTITIVMPEGNLTWTAPKPWWNVTEGYFVIQMFEDDSGALVVTIYGTDADSTAAGAYYFLTEVYPNIDDYNGVSYLVGQWVDTEPDADIPLPGESQGDTSGFSANDEICIIAPAALATCAVPI
ncbi:hypothetical protein A3L11_03510 [Thermococcus siculi]|uniref:Uncharacterized protein n=1 Tax=Thermococcus siculi TaxID=72803 RepID=A0A2Z2MNV6_9EURY|nr:hypothetical protein A3L11_03510 [Thermococcus siculi]